MPRDKGKRNDASTGDKAEGNDPFIPDGIDVWADERDANIGSLECGD
jgi:hypothetical protein